MSANTALVTSHNTAAENAQMERNPISPALAAVIEEENERCARYLRKIARLNGEA
jgi:hypothetical protein